MHPEAGQKGCPGGGVPPTQGPEKYENQCFWQIFSRLELPKAPRGMPEAMAVDPESISPRGGMATPFSPDLMFSGPRFGLAKALKSEAEKSNLA